MTKEALLAAAWPDTVVTDDSLVSCIQELRKALTDDSKNPRCIETRHRRGYRFIATPAAARTHEIGGKPNVAVLPLENTSGDSGKDYLSDAITQEIITTLSKHRTLLVVARGPSFAFKGKRADIGEIGTSLGADFVVQGSVSAQGRRVRIRVQLIEVRSSEYVWADQYDRAPRQGRFDRLRTTGHRLRCYFGDDGTWRRHPDSFIDDDL